MKWNDLPTWVKVVIIALAALLVIYLIVLAVDYFRETANYTGTL